ncbi:MAG TPA: prepilin-type N-terminal cleavage/methylation domain-containing protein [Candidatus Limnocylindria bacterium]|nr:prepilin-type N-terminal cleavage/methylation domain-containing protein [Candidatus Limnocylindria bacterium]
MNAIHPVHRGFTLIELLVSLAILAVLASLLLSSLARAKECARRIQCVSHLKQIGIAAKMFALDHDSKQPWHTRPAEGGTYGSSAATAWRNFSAISNELLTPLVLVCPSDKATKQLAGTWPEFMSAPYRSNAVSFFVGLDGFEQLPTAILAGDRNIRGGKSDKCGSVANAGVAASEFVAGNTSIGWVNGAHGTSGNLGLTDGSVSRANKREFQDIADASYRYLTNGTIRTTTGTRPSNHLLAPRS